MDSVIGKIEDDNHLNTDGILTTFLWWINLFSIMTSCSIGNVVNFDAGNDSAMDNISRIDNNDVDCKIFFR